MVFRLIKILAVAALTILLATSAPAARKKRSPAKPGAHPAQARSAKARTGSRTTSRRGKRGKRGKRARSGPRGQAGPTSERVMEIQEALAKAGAYNGSPTGRFDAATSQALSRFQQSKGLDVTGKIGARTLRELEKYGLPPNTYSAARTAEPSAAISP